MSSGNTATEDDALIAGLLGGIGDDSLTYAGRMRRVLSGLNGAREPSSYDRRFYPLGSITLRPEGGPHPHFEMKHDKPMVLHRVVIAAPRDCDIAIDADGQNVLVQHVPAEMFSPIAYPTTFNVSGRRFRIMILWAGRRTLRYWSNRAGLWAPRVTCGLEVTKATT